MPRASSPKYSRVLNPICHGVFLTFVVMGGIHQSAPPPCSLD